MRWVCAFAVRSEECGVWSEECGARSEMGKMKYRSSNSRFFTPVNFPLFTSKFLIFSLLTPHSSLHTPHSTLHTPHSTLLLDFVIE